MDLVPEEMGLILSIFKFVLRGSATYQVCNEGDIKRLNLAKINKG